MKSRRKFANASSIAQIVNMITCYYSSKKYKASEKYFGLVHLEFDCVTESITGGEKLSKWIQCENGRRKILKITELFL